MNRLEGKVAFITGAARGQGRAHAVRLASEGADIIAVDICNGLEYNVASPSTLEDLALTAKLVEDLGRRVVTSQIDIRDLAGMQKTVDQGVVELGRLDVVVANAGSWTYGLAHELKEEEWAQVIAINLTGAWNTCKVAIPRLIDQGDGGSIILTSSAMGLKGIPHLAHYVAAKHGVVGLMRTLAMELGPHSIRVNTVNPGSVDTDLIQNQATYNLFRPDLENPTREDVNDAFASLTLMPVGWVQPEDISAAVAFLASDDARYVTGTTLSVDAGSLAK